MAAIFYRGEEQEKLALGRKDRELSRGMTVYLEIAPARKFYRAEDYHQKYYLRRRTELIKALRSLFPIEEQLIDSAVAARLNGSLAGYGTGDLEDLLRSAGCSEEETSRIMRSVAVSAH